MPGRATTIPPLRGYLRSSSRKAGCQGGVLISWGRLGDLLSPLTELLPQLIKVEIEIFLPDLEVG